MRQPDAVLERIQVAWRRNWTSWLGGGGRWPLTIPLDPPTEHQARKHWSHFQTWLQGWSTPAWKSVLVTESRAWPSLGSQEIPVGVTIADPGSAAQLLGPSFSREWQSGSERWQERTNAWPGLEEPLRAIAGFMAALSPSDYKRFIAAFDWLASSPDSGLYVRQLPIAGLDSKWIERHAGPLAKLLSARLARPAATLAEVAGLAIDGPRRRIRLLDPQLRAAVGGLSDIQLRLDELASLDLPARAALVIENQQTALACPDLPGTVLLMGGGFAVTELGRVPWLDRIPVLYWGDIDTAGFAILAALRTWHPHTTSCLMDEATLISHRELWSHESTPTTPSLARLTGEESAFVKRMRRGDWGHGVRLEQERIEWRSAWEQVVRCVTAGHDKNPEDS
jgi:hypothetical protein